ncbi:hypothetical protein ACQPUY_15580 [Clostridium nigeriense]|uniref:hypothetical protein n=1 Tax=Clostridium nigeriense TaxID=1805470 RepID=UPI003D33798F
MTGYSIKEAAFELNISDKALYKRISNEKFNTDFLTKIDGKTIITEDGLKHLKSVIKNRKTPKNEAESEVALTIDTCEKEVYKLDKNLDETRIKVYTQNEIDIILMLKDQIKFLKEQLEKQNTNFQEQLNLQTQSYQENLKILLETIKSKEAIILNMQDIIKYEQENTKKLIEYDERSREVDEKLSQIRRELVNRKTKKNKGLFYFLRK